MIPIFAIRTDKITNQRTYFELDWQIVWHGGNLNSWWVKIHNGPTGYESAQVDNLLTEYNDKGWCICAGCNNYDHCIIPIDQLKEMREFLYVIKPVLEEIHKTKL